MRTIPHSLKIVGWLFILEGIWAIGDVGLSLLHQKVDFNLDVFCLFIGLGLLKLNARSRWWALFYCWFGLIFLPPAALVILFARSKISWMGYSVGHSLVGVAFVVCVAQFALTVYEYKVLTNPEISDLFRIQNVSFTPGSPRSESG